MTILHNISRYLNIALTILLLQFAHCALAADTAPWEEYLHDMFESSDEGAADYEAAFEQLTELAQCPLNINKAEVADFLQIPGMNLNIINDILEYRERYGNFRTLSEMVLIPSVDERLQRYLSCFLYVENTQGEPWYSKKQLKKSLSSLQHTVIATVTIPTYYRAGDRGLAAATGNKYAGAFLGDPLKHSLRYQLKSRNNVTFNLTGGKTAAEPFFSKGNTLGYDTYSFNLIFNNLGRFRRIIIGHFRAQYGMGLSLNTAFTMGKQSMLSSVGRLTNAFTPHSSAGDSKHFQGVAVSYDLSPRLQLSSFVSCQYVDATLCADTITVSSLLYSPQHRTIAEMKRKHNTVQTDVGVHLRHTSSVARKTQWLLGLSLVGTTFNRTLNPTYGKADTISSSRLYRLYNPHGRSFYNVAVDYTLRNRTVTLSGETAINDKGAVATLNTALWRLREDLSLSLVQRYYSYRYYAIHGSAFSSGSGVQNESGIYLAVQYHPLNSFTIEGYTDIAYYPWLKYRISGSSYSWDNCITATYSQRKWTFSLRYRANSRQRDLTIDGRKQMAWRTDQRLRTIAVYNSEHLMLKTQAEVCRLSFDSSSAGFIISQQAEYSFLERFNAYVMAAYFATDDYDSRMYAHERTTLYSSTLSSYYGKGIRLAIMFRYNITERLMAMVKAGHTRYFNRNTISSGVRTIFSNRQTDIDLQLKFRF